MVSIDSDIFCKIGEISKDVYFLFDVLKHEFTYISPSFKQVWGIDKDVLLNDPSAIINTIHPEDRLHVTDNFKEFTASYNTEKYFFRVIDQKETVKHICISAYPIIQDGQKSLIAGIAEDMSVIKNNISYMEKINARKNSTLEILVHDLKGPLGMISMMASNIQREAQLEGKENILKSVKFIQDMCKRNVSLVRSLVNSEFLESSEMALRKERADLVWEVNDVIQNYKRSEENIAKTFILNSTHDKLYVEVDSLKFMQVINNLISNALKFTPDNGLIEIDIRDQHKTVLIIVSDNGIGIPKAMQPYLFDKFTRARRRGLRGEEPTGLGMSIIKFLIELHNGKISFESEEGIGSKFYIEIPK